MSKEDDNKAVVVRWFTEFWGKDVNLAVVDEIAAPDMLLQYSLHEPRRGRQPPPDVGAQLLARSDERRAGERAEQREYASKRDRDRCRRHERADEHE